VPAEPLASHVAELLAHSHQLRLQDDGTFIISGNAHADRLGVEQRRDPLFIAGSSRDGQPPRPDFAGAVVLRKPVSHDAGALETLAGQHVFTGTLERIRHCQQLHTDVGQGIFGSGLGIGAEQRFGSRLQRTVLGVFFGRRRDGGQRHENEGKQRCHAGARWDCKHLKPPQVLSFHRVSALWYTEPSDCNTIPANDFCKIGREISEVGKQPGRRAETSNVKRATGCAVSGVSS